MTCKRIDRKISQDLSMAFYSFSHFPWDFLDWSLGVPMFSSVENLKIYVCPGRKMARLTYHPPVGMERGRCGGWPLTCPPWWSPDRGQPDNHTEKKRVYDERQACSIWIPAETSPAWWVWLGRAGLTWCLLMMSLSLLICFCSMSDDRKTVGRVRQLFWKYTRTGLDWARWVHFLLI